ncbi:PDZ domain-containing protein [Candidatus Peregrinibacteria bacterium]|nr:PDZ domain-containing protein [Candidatus Peregrinibacteria bacterium]
MSKSGRIISYFIIFGLVFVFGWESANFYLQKQLDEGSTDKNVSAVEAFSSIVAGNTIENKVSLDPFWKVWSIVEKNYVDRDAVADNEDLKDGAIKGLVDSLDDPYSVYMTEDETSEFDQSLHGELDGIGAELTVEDRALVVVSPLKNSPAENAGLKPGDTVFKIDGEHAADMSLFDAIMSIRGEKGTTVTLTIIREGVDEPFDVNIVRDTIEIPSVELENLEDGIYRINLYQFNDNTLPEFESLVNDLVLLEPKGIILDLRNNGGGYLEIAVDVLSEFIEGKKKAVSIERRNHEDDQTMYLSGNPRLANIPLIVLINGGSASASEIVAGAIQDYKRGTVLGETSFGKGSVQEVFKLNDGSSIRLTIAKWLTPDGNHIDKTGIEPDIEVEFTNEDAENDNDPQLNAALEYLKNL